MARVYSGERVFLTPRASARSSGSSTGSLRVDPTRAGLEGLRPQRARAVRPVLARALPDPAHADAAPVEPAGLPLGHLGRDLQHDVVVRDEHELAVLRRRDDDDLLQPDGGPGGAELRLRRRRHLRRGRADPRHRRRAAGARSGNFWQDLDPHAALRAAADLRRRRAGAGLAGRRPDARDAHLDGGAVARARPGRVAGDRSRSSAPTAAASSTSTRRIRSRTRPGSRTSSRCC